MGERARNPCGSPTERGAVLIEGRILLEVRGVLLKARKSLEHLLFSCKNPPKTHENPPKTFSLQGVASSASGSHSLCGQLLQQVRAGHSKISLTDLINGFVLALFSSF